MTITDNITSYRVPTGKPLRYFIALAMLAILFCSVVLVAFHHHDDDQDHDDDCAICVVAHHRTADITISFPVVTYLPVSYPTFFAALILTIIVTRFCHSPKGRAPPA